jgi:hypothetical protein
MANDDIDHDYNGQCRQKKISLQTMAGADLFDKC